MFKFLTSFSRFSLISLIIATNFVANFNLTKADETATFPYKACFTITGYYSPIPGQTKYGRGSYAAEVALEGNGTNGADGTQVYLGMLAGPPEIPFGTKIEIPGVGIGTVHDRGGAIKSSNNDCASRLDVWMGSGDKGFERTANWGARKLEVTVYGQDPNIKENIYLEGYAETEKLLVDSIPFLKPQIFQNDLGPNDNNEEVKRLQKHLKELGYFKEEETGIYDEKTTQAIIAFQLDQGIILSPNDTGAGYFGVNTRRKIDFAVKTFDQNTNGQFTYGLGLGSYGREVRRLQKYLVELGYLDKNNLTSEYDQKTAEAILKFQLDNQIIASTNETGAGYLGPKTREVFNQKIANIDRSVIATLFESIENIAPKEEKIIEKTTEQKVEEKKTEDILAKYTDLKEETSLIAMNLALGQKSEEVKKLQVELRKLGYLRIEPTGYFGPVTKHALFKLQQNWGLVTDENSEGAGYLGQQTANKLNSIMAKRVDTKKMIAMKRDEVLVAEQSEPLRKLATEQIVSKELKYGDSGPEVKNLQKQLQAKGYFNGFLLTDYFGEMTKEAVIAFQIEKGIIKSADDEKAGKVEGKTWEELKG